MAAHVYPDRAIKRANPALHAAGGIRHHLPRAGCLVTGGFAAKKTFECHIVLLVAPNPKKLRPHYKAFSPKFAAVHTKRAH
jgi:hypothetical protein